MELLLFFFELACLAGSSECNITGCCLLLWQGVYKKGLQVPHLDYKLLYWLGRTHSHARSIGRKREEEEDEKTCTVDLSTVIVGSMKYSKA